MGTQMKLALALIVSSLLAAIGAADDMAPTRIVTLRITNGQFDGTASIFIGAVSRAPFPPRPSLSEAKIAMIQMLANCKAEAFAHCGAKPMVPICPKRLAVCLVHVPHKSLSTTCRIALERLVPVSQ